MLDCTVCGHDNFPVTNAQIYGWADGPSLQMVSRCHQCGAQITEVCKVCRRLHPLKTTHCSLNGIKIQDFIDLQLDIQTRANVFQDLPEAKVAMADIARAKYKFRRIFGAGLISFLCALFGFVLPITGPIFLMLGISIVVVAFWQMLSLDMRISKNMMALWKEANPGVMNPSYINVYSKSIKIEFSSENHHGYHVSFDSRILNLMLSQAKQLS